MNDRPHHRLRAGIVADQCLAKAPLIAHAAAVAAADPDASAADDVKNSQTVSEETLDEIHQEVGEMRDGDLFDSSSGNFDAARAAAREAGDNYDRAGNADGTLRARRTELSLNGDEAMAAVGPLLDRRYATKVSKKVDVMAMID